MSLKRGSGAIDPPKKLQTHLGDVFKLLKDAGERLRPMQKQRDSSSHNHSSLLPAISRLKFLLNISLKQVPRRGPGCSWSNGNAVSRLRSPELTPETGVALERDKIYLYFNLS
ncbi:hypothetical protein K0M31_016974 [Melipona bicolor]|uniref:Uncharacterized protein n=1 Tax=Melipona bicolor TaxID=60889 RepID=A0AA40FDK6_9HYME|nr:hypothetical protein K0M31_016974 [Melipona bicolor]